MKIIKNKIVEVILSFLILSIFISKSLFNFFLMILVILSIYTFQKTKVLYKEKIFYWYLGLLPLGLFSNFYSNGVQGIGEFISSERSLVYILVFLMINLSEEQYNKIKNFILIGGIISAIYSTISFFFPDIFGIKTLYKEYQRTHKMASFQNGIRWARILQILVSFSFINLEWFKKKKFKLFLVIISIWFVWNIVINGQRAAILGATVSMTSFFFMYVFSLKKDRLTYIITIVILTISLGFSISNQNKMIKQRVVSIFDINNNISNKIRIGYWKMGLDILKENNYMGTGSGNTPQIFKSFIKNKSRDYKNKYFKYHEGTPFENSYINIAVENGLMYLVYYLIVQIFILFKLFKASLCENNRDTKIKLMIICSLLLGDKIYIFFYSGTDSYVEFLIVFLMFYGIKLCKDNILMSERVENGNNDYNCRI